MKIIFIFVYDDPGALRRTCIDFVGALYSGLRGERNRKTNNCVLLVMEINYLFRRKYLC